MPQGWAWSNAVCDADYFFDGSLVQLFDLQAGDDITCTFTNARPQEYSDAPASYGDASHDIATNLYLGAGTPDVEIQPLYSANADGDDLDNTDDEDAVASLPSLNTGATSYTLNNILATNQTVIGDRRNAILYGWFDFDGNGQFDANELATALVPWGSSGGVSLTWSNLSGITAGQSYVRLRLSKLFGLAATGPGGYGEVEDHPLNICAPSAAPAASITIAGTQVQLSWTGSGDTFDVYRSSNVPYFTPTAPPYAGNATSPWLDPDTTSIGDVANNYFYVVQTANACGDTADSKRVGEFDFSLVPGTP